MARTHTTPWDYQRAPIVTGAELDEIRAHKDRLSQATNALAGIIGWVGYNQFVASLPYYVQWNSKDLYEEICHELDRYECNCRPDGNACRGCQNKREAEEKRQ